MCQPKCMKHPLLASRVLTAAGAIGGSARHCSRVCTAAAHVGHMDLVVDFNLACYHSLRVCVDTYASIPRLGTARWLSLYRAKRIWSNEDINGSGPHCSCFSNKYGTQQVSSCRTVCFGTCGDMLEHSLPARADRGEQRRGRGNSRVTTTAGLLGGRQH